MPRSLLVPLVAAFALVGACSPDETDFSDAAEDAIEGDLADTLAIGQISAECQDPDDTEDGSTFTCTAETEAGDSIDINAVIEGDDEVVVNAVNVLPADDLDNLEAEAARVLGEQIGEELPAESIDCGTASIVVQVGEPITCALSEPATSDVYDATIVFDDIAQGSFTVEVADTPR